MGKTPMWGTQQQTWGKTAPKSSSIHTTIGLYPRQPYLGVENPLLGQPNLAGIPS
jgi:hypothetical protein